MAGEQKWTAYPNTPGKGGSGWGFIRENRGRGRVFGMDSFDGPNGNAQELADYLNALEAENAGLRAKAELADEMRLYGGSCHYEQWQRWCHDYDALAASRITEEGS